SALIADVLPPSSLALGDDPAPHADLGVHLQHQETRRLEAEMPHVEDLIALDLDDPVAHDPQPYVALDGGGDAVEREVATDRIAAVRVDLVHSAHLAEDAGILPRLEPARELTVVKDIARPQRPALDPPAPRRTHR